MSATRCFVAGAGGSPDEQIALEQAIAHLPPEQREAVHLHAFEGLTFQEIADLTRESMNTVASRYRYALDKLRAHLGARI
jgi:RNA polymerase sigma-70 factor, ECF subfamily